MQIVYLMGILSASIRCIVETRLECCVTFKDLLLPFLCCRFSDSDASQGMSGQKQLPKMTNINGVGEL